MTKEVNITKMFEADDFESVTEELCKHSFQIRKAAIVPLPRSRQFAIVAPVEIYNDLVKEEYRVSHAVLDEIVEKMSLIEESLSEEDLENKDTLKHN